MASMSSYGPAAAVVLLSGGMDSSACAVWASRAYRRDRLLALSFSYGQPHRDAENFAAGTLASKLGLEYQLAHVSGAFPKSDGMAVAPVPSAAVVPGRNAVMLSIAAGIGAARWPGFALDLWVGSCADDQTDFPDCRPVFLESVAQALTLATGTTVRIVAPLVEMTKKALVAEAKADGELLDALKHSFSCYRGTVCGECPPCRLRRGAFEAMGERDEQRVPVMFGGDPSRECR